MKTILTSIPYASLHPYTAAVIKTSNKYFDELFGTMELEAFEHLFQ